MTTDFEPMSKRLQKFAEKRNKNIKVGIDGILFKKLQVDALQKIKDVDLVVNLDQSLVDEAIGKDEVKESVKIFDHDVRYSGKSSSDKINEVL